MKPKSKTEKLNDILLKLAQGFSYTETVEEFVPCKESGQMCMQELEKSSGQHIDMQLAKRKITTHYVPPDMLAIKLLLQTETDCKTPLSDMTDEELLNLKNKLLGQLAEDK